MISSDPVLDERVKKGKKCATMLLLEAIVITCVCLYYLFIYFCSLLTSLASEKISENLHIIANDPSLAFYRMQEHIRKGEYFANIYFSMILRI